MKKFILIFTILLAVNTIQAQKKVKGNGKITKITRSTSEYEGIKCAGPYDFILVAGTEGKIIIEGEENLLDYIITEVKNGHLTVKTKNQTNLRPSGNKSIKITIPFKDINTVSMAGSGNLNNVDVITASNFKSSLAGSGNMILNVQASTVHASVAGSGDLTLNGKANKLEADVSGSGNFNGFELQSNTTDVTVAGSGNAKVTSNETIKARVAGSGGIIYKGNPKTEDTKVSGSGSINNN